MQSGLKAPHVTCEYSLLQPVSKPEVEGSILALSREMSKLCLFEEIDKEVKGKVLCFKT